MCKLLVLSLAMACTVQIVCGQQPVPVADKDGADYHKVEFFVGYSHARVDDSLSAIRVGPRRDPFSTGGFPRGYLGYNGVRASVTGNLNGYFGVKYDFSAHYNHVEEDVPLLFRAPGFPTHDDQSSSLYNYLGGVQVKDNSAERQLKPFGHLLFGGATTRRELRSSGCTPVTVLLGFDDMPVPVTLEDKCVNRDSSDTGSAGAVGGLDVRMSDKLDLRAVQVDFNPTRLYRHDQPNLRFGVGLVIH
jgi:hypothetical protein